MKSHFLFIIIAVCAVFYFFPYQAHADQTTMSVTIVNGVPGPNTSGSSGRGNADRTPPVITSLTFADVTTRSIHIAWETSEPTMAVFRYGRTPEYEAFAISSDGYTRTHVLSMTQLDPSAEYFLQVTVLDRSGNFSVREGWFLLGPPMIVEDIIVDGVEVLEDTEESATSTERFVEEVEEIREDLVDEERQKDEEETDTPELTSESQGESVPTPPTSPTQTPSSSGLPVVSVEDFDQVFGVEHVDQIPEERLLLPEVPEQQETVVFSEAEAPPEVALSFLRSAHVPEQVTRFIAMVRAEPAKILRFTTPGALIGSILGAAISLIFTFLF